MKRLMRRIIVKKRIIAILLTALLLSGCTVTPPVEEPSQETATTTTAETTTVTTTTVATTTVATTTATTATPPTYKPTWTVTVSKTQRPTTTTSVPTVSKTPGPTRPPTTTVTHREHGLLYIDGEAVSGVTEDGFSYRIYTGSFNDYGIRHDGNWANIVGYTGDAVETLTVPDEVLGYPVCRVAFAPPAGIKQIIVPDTTQELALAWTALMEDLTDIWLPKECCFTFFCTPYPIFLYDDAYEDTICYQIPQCAPTIHLDKNSTAEKLYLLCGDLQDYIPFSELFEHEVGREEVFDLSQYDPSGFVGVEEFVTDYKTGELVPYRMSGYISFE